jgi:RNase adaptor protein for sRNA GlmZ degradation
MMTVTITTFGVLHGQAPEARDPQRVVSIDLTHALRNPFDDPAMRELTGFDSVVFEHVMSTPGAAEIVDDAVDQVLTYLDAANAPVDVHSFCKGGRHRSVSVARAIQARLAYLGIAADMLHLYVHKPVVVQGAVPAGYRHGGAR